MNITITLNEENPLNQSKYSKGYGEWGCWESQMIADGVELPKNRRERFNMFIEDSSPPINSGEVHLHADYNSRMRRVIWYIHQGQDIALCKTNRCRKVRIDELA